MLGQRHSQPTLTSLGQGCVFRCNLPPALLAEWSGSFACHCGNKGVERTPNESQHIKLTLEKKILPSLLLGFKLANFRSRVRRSSNKLYLGTRKSQKRKGEVSSATLAKLTDNSHCFAIHNFFTCHISVQGRCHVLPCLNKFSGVVLSRFTLSR